MGMFDDLFSDEDFKIDDEEEESLELETHDEEEPEACGPDCASDCSCVGGGSPSADIGIGISDSYCDDCGYDPCHCQEDCDCSEEEEEENPTVWDTGYKKPPVPKNVWKPKHWKA